MARLTTLFILVALMLPGAALAMPAPDRDDGTRAALNAQTVEAPAPVAGDGGLSLGTVGIGIGLVLVAAGFGVYAGRSMRPRHIGA
jgi:hypothetical protein